MGNKVPILAVFGTSLWTAVDSEQDHAQRFYCECKWNSSPNPCLCPRGATCARTKCMCVKCLTPIWLQISHLLATSPAGRGLSCQGHCYFFPGRVMVQENNGVWSIRTIWRGGERKTKAWGLRTSPPALVSRWTLLRKWLPGGMVQACEASAWEVVEARDRP